MKKQLPISVVTIGLAIFTMLFGAGNIMYPVQAGVMAGSKNYIGIFGFLLTGVLLPIIGLVAMILFDGDYKKFFNRIGDTPSFIAILFCMFIIGPFLVMPRCVTVPYAMLEPFLPLGLPLFSFLFCLIVFVLTYKQSQILNILAKYISPIKIGSLCFIIIAGLIKAQTTIPQTASNNTVLLEQILLGFQTLDLLGALFFAYIIVRLLKLSDKDHTLTNKQLALLCLKGGIIAGIFMAGFYVGLSFLGAYYAHLVDASMNGAEMFRVIAVHIVGQQGVIILITAVMMACLSTMAALAAIFAEYLRNEVFNKKLSYLSCLTIGLITTLVISNFGLTNILKWACAPINFGYPIIVTIAICNIAYSLFDFKWIKLPVFLTTVAMTWIYLYPYLIA
ncbi:MAG TPA: branched-chain amino acid transport system II carrier protein [Candidatus Saccharimonadales bacterium]|nr:branched-chain amino acid transport system II carrier protein [Candidatus Saccharimonadales bacterium]